jgi:hypothetical protein
MKIEYDEATGDLVIRFPVKGVQGTPSASGKTLVVASTRGNKSVDCGDAGNVIVGLNAYRYRG